ncbi:MAG: hypothetical protein HY747_08275 [Elusimicrobia bacterium]|nr:hypothetical protein [Elusimicrobiota bacterium]
MAIIRKLPVMSVVLWCALACRDFSFAVPVTPEATYLNQLFSGITSGEYAKSAVADVLEELAPVWGILPIEFIPLEDELNRFIQRETQRQARHIIQTQAGAMGLSSSLSLNSHTSTPQPGAGRRTHGAKPMRLKARFSPNRIGLSLYWRF